MNSYIRIWRDFGAGLGTVRLFARNHCSRGIFFLALAVAAVSTSLGVVKTAHADILYSTGFEPPTFHAGDQLLGLGGWSTAIPPFLNPQAAVITRYTDGRSRQSVEVRGRDLIGSEGATSPYDAVGSYRRPLGPDGYTLVENKRLARVDADLQLGTKQPKTQLGNEFFSLTIAARSGAGETLGEVGLSSEGIVEAFPFNSSPGDMSKRFTMPIHFNKWYHITMLLDFDNRTTSYFIDDHFLGAVPQLIEQEDKHFVPSASDNLLRGAMVVYARPDGEGNMRSDYIARFDNFRISVHGAAPEIDDWHGH